MSKAALLVPLALSGWAQAATRTVRCGKDDLQKVIDAAVSGDTIQIRGVCTTNARIDGKDLTLVGAAVPGPHGIAALATDRAALSILRSNATTLQNLSFSSGAPGVSAQYSTVSMTDCEASHNTFSGIIISDSSHLTGLRLRLDSNGTRGLQAWYGSRADCQECDLTGNQNWAAAAFHGSLVTMLDSVVSGNNGLRADNHSYIDIDCASFATSHACSLTATRVGGIAYDRSTMSFYGAGDFTGQFQATSGSLVELAGARQLSTGVVSSTNSTPRANQINDGSSLRVEPLDDGVGVLQSRLMETTAVNEFSRALIYGAGTELTGALNCGSAGRRLGRAGRRPQRLCDQRLHARAVVPRLAFPPLARPQAQGAVWSSRPLYGNGDSSPRHRPFELMILQPEWRADILQESGTWKRKTTSCALPSSAPSFSSARSG